MKLKETVNKGIDSIVNKKTGNIVNKKTDGIVHKTDIIVNYKKADSTEISTVNLDILEHKRLKVRERERQRKRRALMRKSS